MTNFILKINCIAALVIIVANCASGVSINSELESYDAAQSSLNSPSASFFVALNGNDTWSGTLDTPNGSQTDGPFLTLERAQKAMQGINAYKTTYIREGTYYLQSPLSLTCSDNNTTWRAYPGETPVLSGGEKLTNWTQESPDTYSTTTTQTGLNASYDNVRLRVAQTPTWDPNYPNTSGWHTMVNGDKNNPNIFYFDPRDLSPHDIQPGVKIQAMFSLRWSDVVSDIAQVDFNNNFIALTIPTLKHENLAYPYYDTNGSWRLLNQGSHMEMPGTFGWRAQDKRFVIRQPEVDNINNHSVVIARLSNIITMSHTNNVKILGLTFSDTDFTGQNTQQGSAIWLNNAQNNTIAFNTFANVGTAIFNEQESNNNTLSHNQISSTAGSSIVIQNSDTVQTIQNRINGYGEISKSTYGTGISISNSNNNLINKNFISTGPRFGIIMVLGRQANANHTISNNQIFNSNQETPDAGAIYLVAYGATNDNQIHITGNHIVNSGVDYCTNCKGIYLDNQTSGVVIENNLIEQVSFSSICVNGGNNVVIRNNVGIIGEAGPAVYLDAGNLDGQNLKTAQSNLINSDDALVFSIPARNFKSPTTQIVINASGHPSNGNSISQKFILYVDNHYTSKQTINTTAQDYVFKNISLKENAIHKIAIKPVSNPNQPIFLNIPYIEVNGATYYTKRTFPELFLEINMFNTTPNNISFYNNIIYSSTPVNKSCLAVFIPLPNSSNIMSMCDKNLYYNVIPAGQNPQATPNGLDTHSIVNQDPLFIDVNHNNYHLQAQSPAYSIGFQNPNWIW